MIKALSLLISLLFVGPTYPALNIKRVKKALNASVVLHMKTQERSKGGRGYGGCSGTYVTPTIILTAAHCFTGEPVEFIWARGPNDKIGYPVQLIRMAVTRDLALLEAPYNHSYAHLGDTPQQGQTVFNVGSPLNFEFVVSEGIVALLHYRIHGFNSSYTVTTAMINPGSSGGGAFNEKGELIGVNTMMVGFFGWQGISMAVSVEDIRNFMRYLS